MQFLNNLKLILSMLPILIGAIKTVEEAIPGSGAGEAKLTTLRAIIEAAYATATDVVGKFDDLWPALRRTIDALVAAFNARGIFKK